jgi:hypothetical protein
VAAADPAGPASAADERGAGVLSGAIGLGVFLAFLFFALQVMFGLYATSTLRATLAGAAARAANGRLAPAQIAELEDDAEASLGAMGRRPSTVIELHVVDEDGDGAGDVVAGRAVAVPPRFVPRALGGMIGFDEVRASVRVRVETAR